LGKTYAHREALRAAGGVWTSGWLFPASVAPAALQAILAAPAPPPAAGAKRKRDQDGASSSSSSAGGASASASASAALPSAWRLRSMLELAEAQSGGLHCFIGRPRACALCGGGGAAASAASASAAAAALQPCALRFALGAGAPALPAAAAQRERAAQRKAAAYPEDMDGGLGALGLSAAFVGVEVVQERHARVEGDWAAGVGHCALALCQGCLARPHACRSNITEMPEDPEV
jgi:hypothetical protein